MRRETDFVLEKAAWPTMLLEAGGRICRANQAARRVFGLKDDRSTPPLTDLWDTGNPDTPVSFLQQESGGEVSAVNLRLEGGATSKFIAHVAKVVRDGQDYFVLQLFKDSGSAFSELAYVPVPKIPQTDNTKLPALFAKSSWPALVVNAQGTILDANPSAASIFGLAVVAENQPMAGIFSNEESERLNGLLRSAPVPGGVLMKTKMAGGGFVPFRVELSQIDGAKILLLQFFAPPTPPAANLSPTAVASVAPPVSADSGDFVLENAEWPALVVSKSGEILKGNRAAVRAFGSSVERNTTRLESFWSPLNQDSCQHLLNLSPSLEPVPLKLLLKSGLPVDFFAQLSPAQREDVVLVQLWSNALPMVSAAVPVVASSASAAGATVDHNAAHKQKLDCALQLARSVALDFNNALTSILGHTSLLLSKTEPTNPWRGSLAEIEKSASKAAEIANDLAAFSRQEKDGKVQVAGNINLVLERTVDVFQGSSQNNITITRQLERKLFTTSFDEAKMQQAFVKIFENSVESIKGPGKINVQTRNLELTDATQDRTAKLNPGNYVCVEISDTGTGIADEVMAQIFEPFFTTKGSSHRGLGLTWVYGIVTNHGGGVSVSSQVDIGTTVRLYLPASNKIVRDAPMNDKELNGSETVLIVDDEDLLLTMGRTVLSAYGYTVLTANSGQKALELFTKSKKKIDLIITDLVMPNMSGRELTEHIQRASPETRIIWSSGYLRSPQEQQAERYLQKPFSAQDLLRKVKQVLVQ